VCEPCPLLLALKGTPFLEVFFIMAYGGKIRFDNGHSLRELVMLILYYV
jgi:hypothetical protein